MTTTHSQLFFISFCCSLFGCSQTPTMPTDAGLVGVNIHFFDTVAKKFVYAPGYWPEGKIWFKNNSVIEQISGISTTKDKRGIDSNYATVRGYIYIDLKNRFFYEYGSFSDTATVLKKYTQPDSVGIVGGWNFYYPRSTKIQSFEPLHDSVIDGAVFKRMKLVQNLLPNEPTTTIGYFRCDKKSSMFLYDKAFSEKIGCPLVRVDETSMKFGSLSRRIDFLRDSLTAQERKIFDVWEKNAKENPVTKNEQP